MDYPDLLFRERPIGTENNWAILHFLSGKMQEWGYEVETIPLKCKLWKKGISSLERGRVSFDIYPGPFSPGYEGLVPQMLYINSLDYLKTENLHGKIVLLYDDLCREPLMPKDFPFFYPDDHKILIDLLEEKQPLAIIAATGKHPMSGQNPFSLFEDGNFSIPNACMDAEPARELIYLKGPVSLLLNSEALDASSLQLIARRPGQKKKKVVVCAHMDTKYDTPGAIDNGAGVMALLEAMHLLKDYRGRYELEFVPFNGEEYFGVSGQLAYLDQQEISYDHIALVVNMDSLGHKNGKAAVSQYNIQDEKSIDQLVDGFPKITKGPLWYAGDHSMFAFQGVPCLALTSSNLFEEVISLTHTPKDTPDHLDNTLIKEAAAFVAEVVNSLKH
ncbi:MAG: M28 family peptidase [Bacteroidales bacterium]|jgi:aminopeptidase YwaD|nr:M28 family peptidase [Bacteroidales bacterium]NLM92058.1 Zn-dependent exopeptidase M28 [Bacteroidales bacterium]